MSPSPLTVTFHTGVQDPVRHTLRVLRKSVSQGLGVLVVGPAAVIAEVDEQLWTADPDSFMAHAVMGSAAADAGAEADAGTSHGNPSGHSARRRLSPIWLLAHEGQRPAALPHGRDMLVNLGCGLPADLAAFSRVLEVIGMQPEQRQAGQQRWRDYRAQGLQPLHHAV